MHERVGWGGAALLPLYLCYDSARTHVHLTLIVWWTGILLEAVILVRAIRAKFLGKYPLFYAYIATVLCVSIVLYVGSRRMLPLWYSKTYWNTQIITLAVGCGVILEIIRQVLSPHPGPARFARWAAAVLFGSIFAVFFLHAFFMREWMPATNSADLERDLRMAQALALFVVVFLIFYYRIAIGRNMRGMIVGFGLYVAVSLISLTLRLFVGIQFSPAWKVIQTTSYLMALFIWVVALWSYEPNPVVEPPVGMNQDALVRRTRATLDGVSTSSKRKARS